MGELDEFAEALIDQISVELDEEKEIADLASRVEEDPGFKVRFTPLEEAAGGLVGDCRAKVAEFTGLQVPQDVTLEFPELAELKALKGRKVFATQNARGFVDDLFEAISGEDKAAIAGLIREDTAKFLTYSTYAKAYISKITTTYGDYLDSKIYLNRFILSRYPQIILYRQGPPYEAGFGTVDSGYRGALKMTVLEEIVHSCQAGLHEANRDAVVRVNGINEELARVILALEGDPARELAEYLQLQAVPDDFPIALRANLFFMLNPDNFIMNAMGPDVLTFTKVEIDPKIARYVPELPDIYQRWLEPIQVHEAAFASMEGMAEFCVQEILSGDADFQEYLRTFMCTDASAYWVRKSIGRDFVKKVFEIRRDEAFSGIIGNPPVSRELKNPQAYLDRT